MKPDPTSATKLSHPALRENYQCLIDGALVAAESGKTFPTLNPATNEKLAEIPDCAARDVDRAVRAAQKSFREWRRIPVAERGNYCRRFAERLRARKDIYAALDALNPGHPVPMMRS